MHLKGEAFRTIWLKPDNPSVVQIIDQSRLPHELVIRDLAHFRDAGRAIRDMQVRGAPLIGATAAWGLYLAAREAESAGDPPGFVDAAARELAAARPTAVNLRWGIDRTIAAARRAPSAAARTEALRREAQAICDEDVEISLGIGRHGLPLIEAIAERKGGATVNVLTHCNAGALATINWGTATAPIYLAHQKGIDVHVWVDETRPRNQGSQLTAWELAQNGVPHTVIVDNAGGHLMQHGLVDLCITGTDRTTRTGDVANKIGTYLKALAAADNGVPFYVGLPSTTIDWGIENGASIPIEERDPDEVSVVRGKAGDRYVEVRTLPESTAVRNYAFDVTPARLITGLITERGVCEASERGLAKLFPERASVVIDEGYTKFTVHWSDRRPLDEPAIAELERWRRPLYEAGLVGHYAEAGIGYGNLSVRIGDGREFVISGTQTGHLARTGREHWARVTAYDIDGNAVHCRGAVQASSETLTHAALYELDPAIRAVVHVHDERAWRELRGREPTTDPKIAYGTPEMAREFARLYRETPFGERRLAVMAGHEAGIVAVGRSLGEAAERVLGVCAVETNQARASHFESDYSIRRGA